MYHGYLGQKTPHYPMYTLQFRRNEMCAEMCTGQEEVKSTVVIMFMSLLQCSKYLHTMTISTMYIHWIQLKCTWMQVQHRYNAYKYKCKCNQYKYNVYTYIISTRPIQLQCTIAHTMDTRTICISL